mgnify:CR=1 FL=1
MLDDIQLMQNILDEFLEFSKNQKTEKIKEISLKNSNVRKHVALDKISKVIYVKEKLINFVIES